MIRDFYKGRTILLTGGTGFYGQALIAKILRDLPEVTRIYAALIRPRKQPDGRLISADERLEKELLGADVLARFRKEDPQGFATACRKVVAVEGDLTAPGLGLEEDVRERLCQEVDLIIAPAGTVVFDAPLDYSLEVNTLGPQALLDFARQCHRDVVFVQVSTAYVSGRLSGSIPEEPLPLDRNIRQMMAGVAPEDPFDLEAEIASCQAYCQEVYARTRSPEQQEVFRREILAQNHSHRLSEKRLAKLMDDRCKRWIERTLVEEGMRRAKEYGWNDVYTFTKAMGEQMLVKHRGEVPLVIVRPSITESSLEDPEPGWIFGLKVADPLIVAYGRGLLPDFPARDDVPMDLVPIDIVINAIITAPTQATPDEVRVFHAATSGEVPLTIIQMYEYVREYFSAYPLGGRNGLSPALPEWTFPSVRQFRRRFMLRYLYPLRIRQWLLDRLPGRLAPARKKRRLAALEKRLKRVLYYADLFSPYTTLDCRFEFGRTRALFEALPPEEQRIFNIDVRRIDWQHYFQQIHLPGLRRHVLKEEFEEPLLREAPEEVGTEEERWQVEESIETIPDLLRWTCARHAGKVALQVEGKRGWVRYTYEELQERVDYLAHFWQEQGLQDGERVLLYAENSPEWVIAYMGASSLGLSVVPLDPQTREEEVWSLAEFTEARTLIISEACFALLSEEEVAGRQGLRFFNLENSGLPFGQAQVEAPLPLDGGWEPPHVEPDGVASIIFTSGTLVEPRGVMLTHRNFVADLLGLAEVQRVYETDQVLSMLPLHHGLEFTGGLLMPLLGGATITYLETLNSREILKAVRTTGTTALLTVPRLLKILGDRIQRLAGQRTGQALPEADTLRGLRLVVSGGAPLAPEICDMYQRFGVTICEGYGLTEAAPIVTVNPPDGVRRGSVGQALPGQEIAIADPDENGEGEILVRGANIMAGYFANPELTSRVIRDGWLHTGDIGYVDEDGYLFITGRCKHLIVTGAGKNIYPEEVEMLYRDLPHVAELSVVGVPSPRTLSEEVHAVAVVERAGEQHQDDETLREAIMTRSYQISRSLPRYQRIQRLHVWKRLLPRLDDGEVDRSALLTELRLERQKSSEVAEIDESLPPWEREIYRQIGRITGLSFSEVVAYCEAPLDTLLDSLMAVEFAVLLESRLDVKLGSIDRSQQTLRQILNTLEPHLAGKVDRLREAGDGEESRYWSRVFAAEEGGAAAPTRPALGKRMLQGLVWRTGGALFKRFFSLRVRGLEHLPGDRPCLIAANHTSHLDSVAILVAVRPRVEGFHLVAAQDYFFQSRLRDWFMRNLVNAVPFDRYGNFQESLVQARFLLGVRQFLLVFPEGTRSLSGQLQPFKMGIGLLAFELGVPVVPIHISGTYQALPKGRRRIVRQPIKLLFGPPLEIEPYQARRGVLSSYEIYREIVEALRREIENLAAQNT